MQKVLSIIICAYNGEKFIDRCLRSVEKQTIGMDKLEVILVDDASTDATLEKFKEWEKKYPEDILVITYDTNKRSGGARNVGLEYSSAEYIGYLDCDDWIEPVMYEKMYEKAVEYQCDVVRCKYARDERESGEKSEVSGEDKFYDANDFDETYPFWEIPLDVGNNGYYGSVCTGIYKRELLLDNAISFPENLYYEDNFWTSLVSLYIKRMYIIDEILYHYYVNDKSITMKRNDARHLERLDIEVMLLEELKKRGVFQKKREIVERNFILCFYLNTIHILFTRFDTLPDVFPIMKEIIMKEFPNYKENEFLNKNITPMGKILMRLLESEHTWNVTELEEIRKKYMEIETFS